MSKIDFEAFKEKFDLSDDLINTINIFFEKLLTYGYISTSQKNKLIRKLYENINEIYIGTNSTYDYKTGFYDANQKILYIKDENDIPAVYLRLLYVIATTEIGVSEYISGYRVTKLATDSYKLTFKNYGLNRAVMANLVCKLCDGLPTNIKITSGFKTYTHNFFGYSIDAPNDIYAIEGKLLSQFCFALNIDEELLYTGIFSNNPDKYLQSILNRKKIKSDSEFFVLLDKISRFYSTYNKLAYLSKKLDENYLEIKKHALDKDLGSFMLEKESIEKEIQKVLSKLKNTNDEDNAFFFAFNSRVFAIIFPFNANKDFSIASKVFLNSFWVVVLKSKFITASLIFAFSSKNIAASYSKCRLQYLYVLKGNDVSN